MPRLYQLIDDGKIDLSDIVTHHLPLEEAAYGYEIFGVKMDDGIKVILKP